jgi:class 3 adenylate cyclase
MTAGEKESRSAGPPANVSADLFEAVVAQADAILVSPDACAGVDLEFAPAGSETLKGFSEPVQLFSPAH